MSGSIWLHAAEVEWLLRGALVAASKDDVTPVLCAVEWTVEGGRATVTATDRYRVHQLYAKHMPDDEADAPAEGRFLMGRAQAALLLKSIPRRNPRALVGLSWVDAEALPPGHSGRIARHYHGTIRFEVVSDETADAERLIHETAQVRGNFPPVARLFPDESSDEGEPMPQVALQPEFLADTRWLRSGHGSLRFVMPRVAEGKQKLAPVLVVNTEGTARALVQTFAMSAVGEWKAYGS